ncbi:intron endonuclease group I [Faustovirus]|nr:intron endonuclease group I [Faustovirus]
MEDTMGNSHLYRAMAHHGIENFIMDIIEEVPNDNDLDDREVYWINHYDSIKYGYNILPGGRKNGYFSTEAAKRRYSIAVAKKFGEDIELRRKYKIELEGLPPRCSYTISPEPTYSVVNHDLCKIKKFAVKHYPSIDAVKEAILKFIKELEEKGTPYDPNNDIDGRRSEIFSERMSKAATESRATNLDNIRHKNKDICEGLPRYFQYDKDRHCFRLRDHEFCDSKNFSIKKYGSAESAKKAALEFIKDLEDRKVKYISPSKKRKFPTGITPDKNGYTVKITKNKIEKYEYVKYNDTPGKTYNNALKKLNQFRKEFGLKPIVWPYKKTKNEE